MPKPHKYRELIAILVAHDARFEVLERRGKGSHRMIAHPDINGRPEAYPLKCHGEGTEIPVGTVSAIERRFRLPKGVL